MTGLSGVEVKRAGWSDLKLPRGHKTMLQAQIKSHFREKRARESNPHDMVDMDIVKREGPRLDSSSSWRTRCWQGESDRKITVLTVY